MKKRIVHICTSIMTAAFIAVSMFALTGCEDKDAVKYSLPDVAVGETFEIAFYGNEGAYQWHYKIRTKMGFSTKGIVENSIVGIPAEDAAERPGAPGWLIYTFEARKAGKYKIEYKLRHVGAHGDVAETRIYTVKVVKSK